VRKDIHLKAIRRTSYIEAVRSVTDKEIIAYVFNPDIDAVLRINGKEESESTRERVTQEKNVLMGFVILQLL
jgi:hypothetical protein